MINAEELLKKYVWYNAELYIGKDAYVVEVGDALKAMEDMQRLLQQTHVRCRQLMMIDKLISDEKAERQ